MDRTLIESQQLDVLFEQMLLNRRQTMEQATSSAIGATGYAPSSVVTGGPDAYGREPVANGANLEYADECPDFCVVAQLPWKGTISLAM